MRKIRFAVKGIINVGFCESLHVELEETVDGVPENKVDSERARLIDVVTQTVDEEIARHKRELKIAQKRARTK